MNIRFLLAFILMTVGSSQNLSVAENQDASAKDDKQNETKTISIIKSKKQFLFKEIIISVIKDTDSPFHVVFNLIIERERTPSFTSQETDLPLIIDTLLSKLLPTLNLFHKEITQDLQKSLEKYIFRLLKTNFDWIKRIEIQNLRIQQFDPGK